MFKVSFKGDFKKVQTFNDRAIIITLVGKMHFPAELWHCTPTEITDWVWNHPSVDALWIAEDSLRLEFSGKSVCAEEDTYDPVLGERIAESRAKLKLYKFVYTLCKKLLQYNYTTMYGTRELELTLESHSESPKDCIYIAYKKYQGLLIKESNHLGKLLSET